MPFANRDGTFNATDISSPTNCFGVTGNGVTLLINVNGGGMEIRSNSNVHQDGAEGAQNVHSPLSMKQQQAVFRILHLLITLDDIYSDVQLIYPFAQIS
jgi:hypothetical protein